MHPLTPLNVYKLYILDFFFSHCDKNGRPVCVNEPGKHIQKTIHGALALSHRDNHGIVTYYKDMRMYSNWNVFAVFVQIRSDSLAL